MPSPESYPLCLLPNDSFHRNTTCCGGRATHTTSNGCHIYCEVPEDQWSKWFDCIGGSTPVSTCQLLGSTTKASQPSPSKSAGSRSATWGWWKAIFFLGFLLLPSLSAAQTIQSCRNGCDNCDIGSSTDAKGPSTWNIEAPYPQCLIFSGSNFEGARKIGDKRKCSRF